MPQYCTHSCTGSDSDWNLGCRNIAPLSGRAQLFFWERGQVFHLRRDPLEIARGHRLWLRRLVMFQSGGLGVRPG
jgi:hypothetical protein